MAPGGGISGRRWIVTVLVLTLSMVAVGGYLYVSDDPRPTADGTFELNPTSVGIEVVATQLNESVTVQLNGRDVATIREGDVGESFLLPTAPGDRVSIVSRTGNKTTLLRERVDDREEVGDFILYYTFDEGAGDVVRDHSRNENHGKLLDDRGGSGPTWITDGERTALGFDGDGDHVYVPDIVTADVDSVSAFTVAMTVRVDEPTWDIQQFVEHRHEDTEWYLETVGGDDRMGVSYAVRWNDQVVDASEALEPGRPSVVVGTYDSVTGEYTLYVDGERVASATFDREVHMGELRIGRDFERTEQYLDGEISELRLYYTAFDDRAVQTLTAVMTE